MQRAFSLSLSVDATGGVELPRGAALAAGCAAPGASATTYAFLRVMPVLMFSVIFWIAYDQMAANFYSQACQSNLYFDQVGGAQMNGSVLNVADCLAIILCIPLFDRLVYPWVERVKGSAYTPLQKIATGFVFAFLAMAAAIAIEFARRAAPLLTTPSPGGGPPEPAISKCSAGGQQMSDLSVYWMLIPYFLIGVAECLISVQLYDVCYNEVPDALRSTAQALNLFMTAISGAIAGAISKALAGYIRDDLDDSHVEYQYYVAAGLALLALPLFVLCTRGFEYRSKDGGAAEQAEADARELGRMLLPRKSANMTTQNEL